MNHRKVFAIALLGMLVLLLAACAGAAALFGMFAYEDAYVRAGQSVPLS